MAEAVFPVLSVTILVLTIAGLVWRGRDGRWVREVQLTLNTQPRLSWILPVFLALGAIALVFFGVGSLVAGFGAGWSSFLLALDALLLVGFTAWLARCPFPTE